jgi:hypothetical protein
MKIIKIHLSRLRAEAHYQLFRVLKNLFEAFPAVAALIGALLPKLLELIELEGKLVDAVRASEFTLLIAEADRRRDNDIAGLSAAVKAFLHHYNPEKAEAARILEIRLKAFHESINKKTYEEETAAVAILIEDLQTTHAGRIAELDLGGWVDRLYISQNRFESVFAQRNDERTHKPQEKLRDVRKQIDAIYSDATDIINAHALIGGDHICDDFIARLNQELEYLKEHEHHHAKIDIAHAEPAPVDPQKYTGQPVTPALQVLYVTPHDGTVKLELGKDYNITYKNNVNVGNAECTIHGKGKYKGHKTVTFIITR